eukprot:1177627-Prymnesium_polylepis.1
MRHNTRSILLPDHRSKCMSRSARLITAFVRCVIDLCAEALVAAASTREARAHPPHRVPRALL